jgi:flagellar basal body-associated protein FliL
MSEEFNPMPEAPVEKKSKKTMIIIIVVAVIVLCCCCLGVIGLYNYGDSILQALNF